MSLWIGHDDYKPLAGMFTSSSAARFNTYGAACQDKPNAPIISTPEERAAKCASARYPAKKPPRPETDDLITVAAWYPVSARIGLRRHRRSRCKESGKIATHYCPNDKSRYEACNAADDSIYWKLTDAQLEIPARRAACTARRADTGDIDPSMPEYAGYFCNIRTRGMTRSCAAPSTRQRPASCNAVLTDPQYARRDDKQQRWTDPSSPA